MSKGSTDQLSASMHFFALLKNRAILLPNKEALVYNETRWTFSVLMQRIAAVATQLLDAGVKPGEKVGILFPNHPDYVAAFFAAAGLGLTIVPINALLKSDEIAHILSDSESTTLILHESTLAEALKSQAEGSILKHIFVSRDTECGASSATSTSCSGNASQLGVPIIDLSQELRELNSVDWYCHINPYEDLALIVYTSGTTGKPKGAMLSHFNMLSIFPERLDLFDVSELDKTLAVLPMCHIYGITILMIGTLSRGGTLAIMPKFEAVQALKIIEKERLTLVPLVPAMYQFCLMELEKNKYDLESVRVCFSGAAALAPELIKQLETAFGAVLVEGFGMTETACVATINPLKGVRKAGSVGPVLPGVEMRVVADDGTVLSVGSANVGELSIKGPNIMKGYYKLPEETQKSMDGDWFFTGDLGYIDEDGYVFIVGRKKEMIIRGGANIYPREIEEVLLKLEQVAEAAVVGVPDKLMGERVKAVLVLKSGANLDESKVKEFCSEHMAEYKVPRIVEFRSTLPRNSTGKILKRMLIDTSETSAPKVVSG